MSLKHLSKEVDVSKPDEVVVVLPYVGERVLMQLRDFNAKIVSPGKWGFFSGSVEVNEDPKEAAFRELSEELGYRPTILYRLNTEQMSELDNIISHSFFCPLTISIKELVLREGIDFGLFSLEEVMTAKLYSQKMKRFFPVAAPKYIISIIEKLLDRFKEIEG